MKKMLFLYLLTICTLLSGCDRNNKVSLFSPDEDLALGKQFHEEILRSPQQYPLLNPAQHKESYQYLNGIVQHILESGNVTYEDKFAWQVYIIQDDETLNAFATPGGYIYVYSGLIKYLDKEDDLAGVLGHEIAHADMRHSTRQLQKLYGLNMLLSLVFGGGDTSSEMIGQILGNLTALSFSRSYEQEADSRSVEYLAGTDYECDAAKSFFIKLREMEQEGGQVPTFLSTHPNPEGRIQAIETKSQRIGCSTQPLDPASYQAFKRSLP